MRCSEITILLATRRDLAAAQEHAVQAHLATCARCAAVWSREERTTRVLRSLPLPPVTQPPARVGAAVQGMLARKRPGPQRWRYGLALAGAALGILLLGMLFNGPRDPRATQPPAVVPSSVGVELSPTTDMQPDMQPDTQPTPDVQPSPTPNVQLSPTPDTQPTPDVQLSPTSIRPGSVTPTAITPTAPIPTPDPRPTPPDPTPAGPPSPPPTYRPGRLYVVGNILAPGTSGEIDSTGSRISILDAQTLQPHLSIEGNDNAVLAPDGSRLYLASREQISAIDVTTQQTLWSAPVRDRLFYDALQTSPDGRWLYVALDVPGQQVSERATYRIQIMNAATGEILSQSITFPGCGGMSFLRPRTGNVLYIICGQQIHALNTSTQQAEPLPPSIKVTDPSLSPDGRLLYTLALQEDIKVQVIDLEQRTVVHETTITQQEASMAFERVNLKLSGDGTTLVIGLMLRDANNIPSATEFQVFDPQTWSRKNVFRYDQAVNISSMALSDDGSTIYGASDPQRDVTRGPYHQLVILDTSTGALWLTVDRSGEDIRQIFSGP
jgi:hypothetical protein